MINLEPGRTASVAAPATSANLGPGFDSLGLALDWRDHASGEVRTHGFAVDVSGLGAGCLPTGRDHLIMAAVLRGLAELGAEVPGLRVASHNTIPQGRGLGSSSAAIVSGVALAWALARPGESLDRAWALRLATAIEGHPDNVAAAVYGGFVIAYGAGDDVSAVRAPVHPDIVVCALVPDSAVATSSARGLLPATVPHADAAANAGRTALLVHALADDPALLFDATEDRLHQGFRAAAMPHSYALVQQLRSLGLAAVISGAGPSVLVLGRRADLAALSAPVGESAFVRHDLAVGSGVRSDG